MIMYDSLNRRMLEPYGSDWVQTPNFKRLSEKTVTFDNCYVGSMPCMPARRELHTGRYNFLHRSWGPIEPYDDSMPEILKSNDIYSHLISDHYHYWEDGGATYHSRYSSWDIVRGQEYDPWQSTVKKPVIPETVSGTGQSPSYWANRKYLEEKSEHYQTTTFDKAIDFIKTNQDEENWFLHLETFDPHEPYYAPERFRKLYDKPEGKHFDWPPYRKVMENDDEIERVRKECAALHTMCDESLGRILDLMDEKNMWEDTMLIVNTDHGFLLGEHGCWAKCWAPFYDEVAHTPFFIWDPRSKIKNERRQSLIQSIDIAPTILDYFELKLPVDMQGIPLKETIANDKSIREAGLFGLFGGHVNCTDGRYVYMRGPKDKNEPLNEYALMPTEHGCGRAFFPNELLASAELADPFPFTKGLKTVKYNATLRNTHAGNKQIEFPTVLYDLQNDPNQEVPIENPQIEARMEKLLIRCMIDNHAPEEQFLRLGLSKGSIPV